MGRTTSLTEERLRLIYEGDGFGGDNTMRAKVIRELIDEIRSLRRALKVLDRSAEWSTAPRPRGCR